MDSLLTDEMRTFIQQDVATMVEQYDAEGAIPKRVLQQAHRIGLFDVWNLDPALQWAVHESIGYHCSSLRSLLTVDAMGRLALDTFASQSLQNDMVRQPGGIMAFALTEPGAGGDPQKLKTKAETLSGGYRLSGHKSWVTGAAYADWVLVFARTDDTVSAFVVPLSTKGIQIEPINNAYATRAAGSCQLRFEQCDIPAHYRLGRKGAGLDWVAARCLDYGRFSVAGGAVGVAKAALDLCLHHVASHPDKSQPLAKHVPVQQDVAEMVADIETTKALAQKVISLRQSDHPNASSYTTLLKYKAAQIVAACTQRSLQLLGHRAFTEHAKAARLHRDAQCFRLIEGTETMNAINIANAAYRSVFHESC